MYTDDTNNKKEKEDEEDFIDIRQSAHLRAKDFYGDDDEDEDTTNVESSLDQFEVQN